MTMTRNKDNILFVTLLLLILNWNNGASSGSGSKFHRADLSSFRSGGSSGIIDADEDFVNSGSDHITEEEDSTGCPPEFQKRCDCKSIPIQDASTNLMHARREKFVVKCDTSGFTNTTVLQFLPRETEELIFTNNKIPFLHPNIFGVQDYPFLKKIDFTNNQIRVIDGQAFHHVASVETLILNYNDLSSEGVRDHPRMFSNFYNLKELYLTRAFNKGIWSLSDLAETFHESNLTKLTKLHMEQNDLELITNLTMFCTLPSLLQLYLGQNKLHDLNLDDTSCFKNLDFIDLRENQIQTITKDSGLWKMSELKNQRGEDIRVDLLRNPINCDCKLDDFIHWLRKQSLQNADLVRDNEQLRCADGLPLSNKNSFVKGVEVTECPPPLEISNYNGVTTVVIWLLIIALSVVLVMTAYWNRSYFRRQVRPLLEPSAHGVKYTSIQKSEEAEIAHV